LGASHRPRPAGALRRFAVLVPAHDEEAVLGRLLANLLALDYPRDLVRICVVADNCTDRTAALARGYGVDVFEREDRVRVGKGYALQWLLNQLDGEGYRPDAYVIVDADSALSANYLTAMNARLNSGAAIAQAYYTVLPVHNTRSEALREAALALVHFLRPCAKTALGASCGLKGNGMCFSRAVIERFGWPTAGLAEDVEFHLLLIHAGLRVEFVPEAIVRGEMPPSLRAAGGQNMRWEAGRLATIRRQALPLLAQGVRARSATMVDAALEQFLPPLSVPALLAAAVLILAVLARSWAAWPAGAACVVLALYVGVGLVLARAGARVYRSLLLAPVYMIWKLVLYTRALAGPRERRWVRTERVVDR
jgi:cellulose synthase/poly-beta-1,6-N-acetylglucosamine synthase-like glycosyltransferase